MEIIVTFLTAKLNSQDIKELKMTILIVIYYQYEYRAVPIVIVREEELAKVPLGTLAI